MVAAPSALTNCTLYVAGYDMTSDSNKLTVSASADELDVTTFGSGGFRQRIGGLKDVEAQYEGFLTDGAGEVGETLFPALGTANEVHTASPTGVAGTAAYAFQAGKFQVEQFGDVGSVSPFSLQSKGTNGQGLIRGQVAAAKQTKSATGILGSILTLTAPTSTQYVYAAVHCFSAGTTVTVQVQSDDDIGFASPTTRGTFTAITAAGGYWLTRVAGPFASESFWRLNISSITGTFSLAGFIAVQ